MFTDQLVTIDTLLNTRDVKKAEILLARHLRTGVPVEERAELLTRRARARLLVGRCDDALEDLHEADTLGLSWLDQPHVLELVGDCHLARFELASVGFADRADTARAAQAYERLIAEFPNFRNLGWVFYQKGRVLLTENGVEGAISCFQLALLNPSYLPTLTAYAYERLGFIAFYEMRDLPKALTFLDKAVHTYPATENRAWIVQIHTLRSRVLREMRHFPTALEAAELAINTAMSMNESKSVLADALLTAGEVLTEIEGRERDVVAYLQQFTQFARKPLGIDVTWSRVYEMLGDAYFKIGQHQAAVNAYQSALQFNPYHPWEQLLHYRAARSYYQLGEYEKSIGAIQRMQRSAQADGQPISDFRVYQVLGNAQYALGQFHLATHAYQTALDLAPSSAETEPIEHYLRLSMQLSGSI